LGQESDDENIEEILVGDMQVVKVVAPKGYKLRRKCLVPNTPSSKEDNIPLRKITPPLVLPKKNCATPGKTNNKNGKPILENKDKPRTFGSTRNDSKINLTTDNEKIVEKKFGHAINNLDYNLIEELKKTKSNIFMFYIYYLTQQCEIMCDAFKPHDTQKGTVVATKIIILESDAHEIHKVEIEASINATSIGTFL